MMTETIEADTNEMLTETIAAPQVYVPSRPSDATEEQRLRLMEISGTHDFWSQPGEDIYTLDDGEPV